MQAKIVGIKKFDFVDKNGNNISGKKFFGLVEQANVEGYATLDFSISSSRAEFPEVDKLKVQDTVNVYFNQYGKVETVVKA